MGNPESVSYRLGQDLDLSVWPLLPTWRHSCPWSLLSSMWKAGVDGSCAVSGFSNSPKRV